MQKRLAIGDDGRPLLTVDPRCTNLIREFETYEWMPDRDKPRKAFDHALDALRYAIMSYDGAVAPMLTVVSLADDPISRDDWMDNPEMWQEY